LNPNGRAGKNALGQWWVDKKWKAYLNQIERDAKWVDRLMRKHIGCSLDQADRILRKR
jgi:hypothetical protein